MELGGWDTHAGQSQRLNAPLKQLDDGMVALKTGLGDDHRQMAGGFPRGSVWKLNWCPATP